MNRYFSFFLAIFFIFIVVLTCHYCTNESVVVSTHTSTDTIYIEKIDTLYDTVIQVKEERIVDTIYVKGESEIISLPITQKHYSDTLKYDLWVSGYEPNLDSIKVYTKTTTVNVQSNTIKVTEVPQKSKVYVFCGFNALQGEFIPKAGVFLKTKKEWLITPEIGLYHNKLFYGISIGKNINF